jgi:hypothetical protein
MPNVPPREGDAARYKEDEPRNRRHECRRHVSKSHTDRSAKRAESCRIKTQVAALTSAGTVTIATPGNSTVRFPERQTILRSDAHFASSWRLESCSFRNTDDTCVSTVLIDIESFLATCL